MRYKVNIQIMRVGNSTQDHATIVVVVEVHYHLPQPMHLWLNKGKWALPTPQTFLRVGPAWETSRPVNNCIII